MERIAKYILDDISFIKSAISVRNLLLHQKDKILEDKKSKYNSNVFLDKCQICNKNKQEVSLDVHHILFQKDFDENENKDHLKKDDANNLVVLCKEHHTYVHQNRLKIFGYTKTVNGSRKLKYEFVQEKRKVLKYQSMVKYITTTYKKD